MRKAAVIIIVIALTVALCACSMNTQGQMISGNRITGGRDIQRFEYAYIYLGGNLIAEGKVEQWRDYTNSDTIQVVIDGNYYLTHYTNVVMKSSVQNALGANWDALN